MNSVRNGIRRFTDTLLSPFNLEVRTVNRNPSATLWDCLPSLMHRTETPEDHWVATRLFQGIADIGSLGITPHGQLLQDALVVGICGNDGYFVEVGSGHPERFSNTHLLDRHFGWSGLRVEPNPKFAELHRAVASERVSFYEVVATGDQDGWSDLIMADELSAVRDKAPKDGYQRQRRSSERLSGLTRVRSRPIRDLLVDASTPSHVHYLSIDTEGSELEILAAFPFDRTKVDVITIEHNHNAHVRRRQQGLLFSHGFKQVLEPLTAWESWFVSSRLLSGTLK